MYHVGTSYNIHEFMAGQSARRAGGPAHARNTTGSLRPWEREGSMANNTISELVMGLSQVSCRVSILRKNTRAGHSHIPYVTALAAVKMKSTVRP